MIFKEHSWWFYSISEVKVGPFKTPEEAIEKALMSVKTSGLLSADKADYILSLESVQAELNKREAERKELENKLDDLHYQIDELEAKINFER